MKRPSGRRSPEWLGDVTDPSEAPIVPGDPRPLVRGARWQRTPDSPIYVVGRNSRQWSRDHPPWPCALFGDDDESPNKEKAA